MFKLRKIRRRRKKNNTRNKLNVFKDNNKDTRIASVASNVNFEHILKFIQLFFIADFEQINAGWV